MIKNTALLLIIVALLVLIDGYLLSHPNLLGRLGFVVYRYYFLKNFLRATLTVGAVASICLVVSWAIQYLVVRQRIAKSVALIVVAIFIALTVLLLVKTIIDFGSWSHAHAGIRLRIGAYLLPCLLALIFGYRFWRISQYQDFENLMDNASAETDDSRNTP